MTDHDAIISSRPFEDRFIVKRSQPDILNAHDVELWIATEQASNNIVVEVLIDR
jgi:hypothetical protein